MTIAIGIIGTGGIARRHVRALEQIDSVSIEALYDTDPSHAHQLAALGGGRVCESAEECIGKSDAVYICTPPSSHLHYTRAAADAGKHIMIEKPIAIALDDAAEIVDTVERAGVVCMVGFNMRFRKSYMRLKELVENKSLGTVLNIWSQRIGSLHWKGYNWRYDPEQMCGMSIESLSHDIDFIRWIAGEIVDVRATIVESIPELKGFDDNANVVFSLSDNATACIHSSWSSPIRFNSRGIIGTSGTAYIEGPKLWDIKNIHWQLTEMPHEMIEVVDEPLDGQSYIRENESFVESILAGTPPPVGARDGLRTVQVSHAILQSHREKSVVQLGILKQ
jgi:myo-inositol 2-dehydrogenase/D-chiro-inositol 1-dehydrogenase